jgi:branched-chain amino acid transport system ATP-binding protein
MLEGRALEKRFGGVRAVSRVDLVVPRGERRAVIGPNGAGKTTLFNLITGEVAPDAGEVVFEGTNITGVPSHALCRLGIARTFQISSVFRRLSALENAQVALLAFRRRQTELFTRARRLYRDEALAVLDRVGLLPEAPKPAGILSHGDRKRLELAMALAAEPRLLMLDEPTAGMAPGERRKLMELVTRIAGDAGLTVLFTEHDMDVVFAVATRVSVMHQGAIIAEGTPDEVRGNEGVRRVYLGQRAGGGS